MSRVSRRTGVLAVLLVLLVTSCADGSASDAARSDGAPPISRWPEVRQPLAAADDGCTNQGYDSRVYYTWTDPLGELLGEDLVVCTTAAADSVWVHNTSKSVLWAVDTPAFFYWSPEDNAEMPITVQIFRDALRELTEGAGPFGRLTVEPGTSATLPTTPFELQVSIYPDQQALWSTTALVVQQVWKRTEESIFRILRAGSRTRGVVIACAIDGFRAGEALTEADGDPSDTLAAGLGLAVNAPSSRCATAVQELEDELRRPRLTLSKLQSAARPTGAWASLMDRPLLGGAIRVAAAWK